MSRLYLYLFFDFFFSTSAFALQPTAPELRIPLVLKLLHVYPTKSKLQDERIYSRL